jgi:hypothetical protein
MFSGNTSKTTSLGHTGNAIENILLPQTIISKDTI